MINRQTQGILIALVGTTAWATTGIFISYLLRNFTLHPLTLAFWRDLFVAVAIIAALAVLRPSALKLTRRDVPFFIVYGFFGLAVFNGLWTESVDKNGAAVATVLAYSSPAFTVILARLFLRESLTPRKVLATALSLLGCTLVAQAFSADVWRTNAFGILVGLGTGLAFAFYSLAGRWSSAQFSNAWTVTAYGFLFAAMGLALTQTPDSLFSMGTQWNGWIILAVLAIGPTVMGFGLYTLSLRYLQASVASLIASLEPALTAVMAIIILGESLSPGQWFGAILILLAVALVQSDSTAAPGAEPLATAPGEAT